MALLKFINTALIGRAHVVLPAWIAVRSRCGLNDRWLLAAMGDIDGFTYDIAQSGAVIGLNFDF